MDSDPTALRPAREAQAEGRTSEPGLGDIPILEARETSGMTSKLVLSYAERMGGRGAVDAVLRRCGLEDRERELRDESSWFSYESKIRLFEALAEVLDDPHVTRRMGETVLDLSVGEGLRATLRALGTPGIVYRNVVRANARFSAVQGMELLELGREYARVRFDDLAGVGFNRLDCEYTAGLLSCVPTLFGQPLARISHPICGVEGAEACIYEISWSEHVSPLRAILGSAAASTLALGGSALLAPALLPAAGVLAAAAGGATALRVHRINRRRLQQLEREVREQSELGQRLAASLQDLTGELRLDELLEKITHNAQSAVGGKEYALLVNEGGRLRCLGSSGLPPATLAALELWLVSRGTLTEPIVIDDVSVLPELAPIGLQESMPLGSLCAVPLSYQGRTLGALVALANQRRTFLPRDVDLLGSYAVQAAIALLNARLFEMQERLAARDPLTGVLNRRELHEHLGREIERCRRHGGSFAVVVLDLDGFKLVNDTSGHSEGDDVLRAVGTALSECARGSDVVFRMGGDEFALLLPGCSDREAAAASAERACAAIRSADSRVNASYGLASWPGDGIDQDAVLAVADRRLYRMKGARSSRYLAAQEALQEGSAGGLKVRQRLALVSSLSERLAPLHDPVEIAEAAVEELRDSFSGCAVRILRIDDEGTPRPLVAEPDGPPAPIEAAGNKLSLPIRVGTEIWGVLNVNSNGEGSLDEDDSLLMDTVTAQIGSALQVGALLERVERTFTDTVSVLSDALEAKDVYTAAHTREVADLAERVGIRLGMRPDELRTLRYAALLHDIGKIAVRGEVLNKPGPLTDEEFDQIRLHTVTGARMLERVEQLRAVLPLIRFAHERWDGAGYPDGIAKEEIPLGARVICVCDAFHAMVSDRPYRAALPFEQAVAELRRCSGTQFDPAVVEALLAEIGPD